MITKKAPNRLLNNDELIKAYGIMYQSRFLDEKMLILLKQGKSYFHIGCMGHEAIQVACGMAMDKNIDYLFPYYRDQALCMTLGQTSYECLLSFLGKKDDPHGGARQMPMHYGNKRLNIPSSSSSTGTQFLQATGAALAAKHLFLQNEGPNLVCVVTAGDGTTSQGEFYEAISWAALKKAPIVFLIENNAYAISVNIAEQRPGGLIAANFSSFFGLKVFSVDGCDLDQSYQVLSKAIKHARLGLGPCLIDASVVRLLPHSSSDDDKKYRSSKELIDDKARDPLLLLRQMLLNLNLKNNIIDLEKLIEENIEADITKALNAKDPDPKDATKFVFSDKQTKTVNLCPLAMETKPVVMIDAINRALKEGLLENNKTLVFGQDVAHGKGGVFGATRDLSREFGDDRVFNTPLAEASIIGVAIGYALKGFRPIPEIQFGDYIWTAMMQIRNELSTMRYRSNNSFALPVVIRVPVGGYIHGGLCHSQNIEATFAHFPGLKIAMPSNAFDAYALLKNALISEDPVLFLEHKALYRQNFASSLLPKDNDYHLAFGQGIVRQTGEDVSVITYGILVKRALEAASILLSEGIRVEVIDLRTIVPYDEDLVFASIRKTGKVLVLHEDMRFMGFGAEIASNIAEHCFMDLDAPIMRLAAKDTPVPYSPYLEEAVLPQPNDIIKAIRELASY